MPRRTARREDTDFALHPRSMPAGFSRGQASPVGRLRTASRRSNANPTPAPAEAGHYVYTDVGTALTCGREQKLRRLEGLNLIIV